MNQNILKLLETPLVPDAQAKVLSYFEEVKGSDTGWQLAITELTRTADNLSDHTKFFWWQIVENFVKTRYTQMDSASLLMRNFLFQWLHNMVVDREIPHSKEEADRNTLIKDTIRETCINDLVNSWYQICVLYEMSDSKLVSECLDVIGAYISWIDISLIANERFVTLFIRFMKDQHLREPDCDCLCEVVAKGMDSSAKVKLIESLYSLLHGAGVFVIDNEEDSDYLCKLGKLINTMGVQLAVSWTRLKKANDIKDAAVALDAIENKLPVIYAFLGNEDDDVSASVLEYIKEYIIILKQKALLSSVDRQHLESLISINFEKMKYDESYNFDNDGDEEAQFLEFRKQLKKLYDNIASLDKDLILSRTQQLVTSTLTNWQTLKFQDVELAITCLYELGEAVPSSQGNHFASDMVRFIILTHSYQKKVLP
ncbi:hypothetical protein QYM36_005920 [Artemia franciscana]|uniref:Exportin-T n=1 Tax=Artemia franciscana TaxID=6661 RepID=A0AA88HZE1_ARTSF|nr:hypothetical protein QYM36_005920 [Artemia franciscana]KAK2718746.1 hypothetical protein QYM36_005920 [Artemia franciscana]